MLRDFFQTRPLSTLLDVFRAQDVDGSRSLDRNEFAAALKSLHIEDLTEKDMNVLFRNADVDGSGALEFDEFFHQVKLKTSLCAARVVARMHHTQTWPTQWQRIHRSSMQLP